jgi:hypothetical protein
MLEVRQLQPDFEGPALALVIAYAHVGRLEEARATLRAVPTETITAMLGFFPHPNSHEIIRAGLALAEA